MQDRNSDCDTCRCRIVSMPRSSSLFRTSAVEQQRRRFASFDRTPLFVGNVPELRLLCSSSQTPSVADTLGVPCPVLTAASTCSTNVAFEKKKYAHHKHTTICSCRVYILLFHVERCQPSPLSDFSFSIQFLPSRLWPSSCVRVLHLPSPLRYSRHATTDHSRFKYTYTQKEKKLCVSALNHFRRSFLSH